MHIPLTAWCLESQAVAVQLERARRLLSAQVWPNVNVAQPVDLYTETE